MVGQKVILVMVGYLIPSDQLAVIRCDVGHTAASQGHMNGIVHTAGGKLLRKSGQGFYIAADGIAVGAVVGGA